MAEQRLSDEHAQQTAVAAPSASRQQVKRRGLIAGAAALVAGVLAKQAASPVSAWDSTHTFQSATGAATSLSPDVYADGIQGYADGGNNAGVFGRNNALNGIGVSGIAPSGIGVSGTSTSGVGLSGSSTGSYGVVGSTTANGFAGVAAMATAANTTAIAASTSAANTFAGVFSGPVQITNSASYALNAGSTTYHGVIGTGYAAGAAGLFAQTFSSGSYALIANGIGAGTAAAAFNGAVGVNGNFIAYNGTKSAAVPHPDGSYRLLYCVESPESWFEDFGTATLTGGKATITIDPEFAATVLTDQYHVFLTAEGDTNGLYVTNKTATGFTVQEQKGGTSGAGFAYRIVARRKDVAAARLAKVAAPFVPEGVPPPPGLALPGLEQQPPLPVVDTKARPATPAPAPAVGRSSATTAPPTATSAPTNTPVSAPATATSTPTPSGTPAVIASPRATASPTTTSATATTPGSVAPAPPRR